LTGEATNDQPLLIGQCRLIDNCLHFAQLRIDEEAIPEALRHVMDQALGAICRMFSMGPPLAGSAELIRCNSFILS